MCTRFLSSAFSEPPSPLIPLPTTPPSFISAAQLQQAYLAWTARERSLTTRLRALEAAVMRGATECRYGKVELRKEVRRCTAEARFVRGAMWDAMSYCTARKGRMGTNKDGNPVHFVTPPSLITAGFILPLPIPPKPHDFTLLLPKFFQNVDLPPTYHEETDVAHGEMSLGIGLPELNDEGVGRSLLRAISTRAMEARWR